MQTNSPIDISAEDITALFSAGAYDVAIDHGATEKAAEDFAYRMYKKAADGDYDPEGDTWWERNKSWLIPVLVGGSAFWAGASGERHGRPDRGYIRNAYDNIARRVEYLLGSTEDSPTHVAATYIPGAKTKIERVFSPSGAKG